MNRFEHKDPVPIKEAEGNPDPDRLEPIDIDELIRQREQEFRVVLKVKTPVATYILIAINVMVFALIYFISMQTGNSYSRLLHTFGAKVNTRILAGEYWRLITPIFLHASVMHLAVNCYSLYALGVTAEKLFGRFRFLTVYLVAGVLGNIFSLMFSPNPGVGASGAIFGLLGTMLYFGLEKPALFRASFGRSILFSLLINLAYGFSNAGIDNFAHIGGLIGGFLASGIVAKTEKKRWYFNRYLYIAVTLLLIVSGLAYGFNSKQNRIALKTEELVTLDEAQEWSQLEAKAEELLELGLKNEELKVSILWTLAKAEAMTQKYDEAVLHAEELSLLDPQNGHYMLGILYFDMQQFNRSKEELLKSKNAGADYEQIDQILSDIEAITNQ